MESQGAAPYVREFIRFLWHSRRKSLLTDSLLTARTWRHIFPTLEDVHTFAPVFKRLHFPPLDSEAGYLSHNLYAR